MSGSQSTVETEIKLRINDPEAAKAALQRCGFAETKGKVFEINHIYDDSQGEIRRRGELLRIRTAADTVLITFKGKAEIGRHKSREELEMFVSGFDSCEKILNRLGFHEIFRYEKYRTEFGRSGESGVVTVDETPIGSFLELEGVASWIDAVAKEMGYTTAEYITASYGRLYIEYCAAAGVHPGNMVFRQTA